MLPTGDLEKDSDLHVGDMHKMHYSSRNSDIKMLEMCGSHKEYTLNVNK